MKAFFLLFAVLLTGCGGGLASPYKSLSVQAISVNALNISSKIIAVRASGETDETQETGGIDHASTGPEAKTQNPPLITTHN